MNPASNHCTLPIGVSVNHVWFRDKGKEAALYMDLETNLAASNARILGTLRSTKIRRRFISVSDMSDPITAT
jgi:hypothetical protein